MKLLLIVCVLALAVTPGQAQNPESFRVLDKINGILDRELNVLDGGSSQVALRGNMNFMKVGAGSGSKWTTFKDGAKAKYEQLQKLVEKGKKQAQGVIVYAKSAIKNNPYKWMAFKVGVATVSAIFCPACTFLIGLKATFLAIDTYTTVKNIQDASNDLPEGLSDEAKAACLAGDKRRALLVFLAGTVTLIFDVDIPVDLGTGTDLAVQKAFEHLDVDALVGTVEHAGGLVGDGTAGAAEAGAKGATNVVSGAMAQKMDDAAGEARERNLNKKKGMVEGKVGLVNCTKITALPAETGEDADTQPMEDDEDPPIPLIIG